MLGQTSSALAERAFQVDSDDAATSRYVGSCKSSRLFWTGLGLAGMVLLGLSAWAVVPASSHVDSQSDPESLRPVTEYAFSPGAPGVEGSVVRNAKGVEFKPAGLGYISVKPSAGRRGPLSITANGRHSSSTLHHSRPALTTLRTMKVATRDKNLFLETSQKDEAWLDGFQKLPDPSKHGKSTADTPNGADEIPQLSMDPKHVPDGPEPFGYVQGDVISLSSELSDLVKTDSPVLKMAATQLFSKRQQGKGFRPTLVTLVSLACSGTTPEEHRASKTYNLQTRLAQITEMIHVASLIHDDVLDEADTRRGQLAVHQKIGNKVAILAGDYLLATASQLLANLGDNRVVQIMASALKSLVQGEIMQLQAAPEDYLDMRLYLRKSYYKTGSLITLSANSAAVLGGHDSASDVAKAAETYGYHLGLAYQIVDDVLDFAVRRDLLGMKVEPEIALGLATAPVLYALKRDESLRPLILRRFSNEGDVKKAFDAVHSDNDKALGEAMQLARWHAQAAVDAIYQLPPSDAREALVRMAHSVLTRAK